MPELTDLFALRVGRGHDIDARGGRVIVVCDQPLPAHGEQGPLEVWALEPAVTRLAQLSLVQGATSRRWPRTAKNRAGLVTVVSQISLPDQTWRGLLWEEPGVEHRPFPCVGDRALALTDDAVVHINGGQYSAMGIAGWLGNGVGWVGTDQLRERYAHLPGFWAWDATEDRRWVVGSSTTGPDRCLLRGPLGRVYRVFEGLSFEPRVSRGDDGRIWVTAAGANNRLRIGVWTEDELETLIDDEEGRPMVEVTIGGYVDAGVAPCVAGFSYTSVGAVKVWKQVRPVGDPHFQEVEVPPSAAGFSSVELTRPGVYELRMRAEGATGEQAATGRQRLITVREASRPLVIISSDQLATLEAHLAEVAMQIETVAHTARPRNVVSLYCTRVANGASPVEVEDELISSVYQEAIDALVALKRAHDEDGA